MAKFKAIVKVGSIKVLVADFERSLVEKNVLGCATVCVVDYHD
jgi:hypothetical protein